MLLVQINDITAACFNKCLLLVSDMRTFFYVSKNKFGVFHEGFKLFKQAFS